MKGVDIMNKAIESRLERLEQKLEAIESRLERLEQKLEAEKNDKTIETAKGAELIVEGSSIEISLPQMSPHDYLYLNSPPRLIRIYELICKKFKDEGVTANKLAKELNCSKPTARLYLARLYRIGVLLKRKNGKESVYYPVEEEVT